VIKYIQITRHSVMCSKDQHCLLHISSKPHHSWSESHGLASSVVVNRRLTITSIW